VKIKILDEAQDDLIQGFRFYEGRDAGLGATACSQILILFSCTAESIKSYMVIAVASPSASRLPFTIAWWEISCVCMPYWIIGEIPCGSGND